MIAGHREYYDLKSINVDGTDVVRAESEKAGVTAFVYTSTMDVCAEQLSICLFIHVWSCVSLVTRYQMSHQVVIRKGHHIVKADDDDVSVPTHHSEFLYGNYAITKAEVCFF